MKEETEWLWLREKEVRHCSKLYLVNDSYCFELNLVLFKFVF